MTPAIALRGAGLAYGNRVLWRGLDLAVRPGEFLAVLGANGTGKSSLLRVLLGLQRLTEGTVEIAGRAPRRGDLVGYVPQRLEVSPLTPLRARDLVRLGVDGHRWGFGRARGAVRARVDEALRAVGAEPYADVPLRLLSGGERQRVRIAQALASDPRILLCDEPLLSLDPGSQATVAGLIDERRRTRDTAVVFVTHEIEPILGLADRVLYLAGGRFRVGAPDDVLTSPVLSDLYGTPVQVVRAGDHIAVVGAPPVRAEGAA